MPPRKYIVAFVIVLGGAAAFYFAVNDTPTESVATVNGEAITFDEVAALMPAAAEGAIDNTAFLARLTAIIADHAIVGQAESQFGVTRSEAEIDAEYDDIVASVTESGVALADILSANNLTETGLRAIAGQQLLQRKVQDSLVEESAAPSEDLLTQRYNASLATESSICASHILLESEEGALLALDRARAGEDFGELAAELSVGPSGPDGGDLGCGAPAQFVAEFANATLQAPVGEAFGPVQTQFGFHVLFVSERTVPTFEEQRPALEAAIAAEAGAELWTTWLIDAIRGLEVTVDPLYGTWTVDPVPQITPPATP